MEQINFVLPAKKRKEENKKVQEDKTQNLGDKAAHG